MKTEEEMRQALRSLSGAKNRQREAEKLAKQVRKTWRLAVDVGRS
jgi:phage/plasmid primase-like uncharacterized protein